MIEKYPLVESARCVWRKSKLEGAREAWRVKEVRAMWEIRWKDDFLAYAEQQIRAKNDNQK